VTSVLVEMVWSSDTEHSSTKVDDQRQMSIDELCLSVNSISLTGTSSVERVTDHVFEELDNTTPGEQHHVVDAAADEGEGDKIVIEQLPKLDGRTDVGAAVIIPIQDQIGEEFVSRSERADEVEVKKEAEIASDDSRREYYEDKDGVSATAASEDKKQIGSTEQCESEIGSPKLRRCIPQEHDENTNEVIDQPWKNDEAGDNELSKIVPRGPIGGVPVIPENVPACTGSFRGAAGGYGNAAKYRKPVQQNALSVSYQSPDSAHFMNGDLMNSGQMVYNNGWREQSWYGQGFDGGFGPPSQMMGCLSGSDELINECLCPETSMANSSDQVLSFVDCDAIMKSLNGNDPSGCLPVPREQLSSTPVGISAIMSPSGGYAYNRGWEYSWPRQCEGANQNENDGIMSSMDLDNIVEAFSKSSPSVNLPVWDEMPLSVSAGISASSGHTYTASQTAASPSKSSGSPAFDGYSDCISPGWDYSPENPSVTSVLSPASTMADSGISGPDDDDYEDRLNDALEVIKDDEDSAGFYVKQCFKEIPKPGSPKSRISNEKDPNVKQPVAEMAVSLPPVIIVSKVSPRHQQVPPISSRFCKIAPRPSDHQQDFSFNVSANTGLLKI